MMNARALTSNYQTIWKEKDENERKKLFKEKKKYFPELKDTILILKGRAQAGSLIFPSSPCTSFPCYPAPYPTPIPRMVLPSS